MALPAAESPGAQSQPAAAGTTQPAAKPLVWDEKGGSALPLLSEGGPSPLWQMLAAVAVIVVLGGLALLVVRKLLPRIAPRGGKRMAVVETIYLEPRKALHLVRVGGQKFLLAASREGLSVLAEVTDVTMDEPDRPQQTPSRG
jgi:flagellar biogenesis protein FliO